MLKECFDSVGWSKKSILIHDITMYLVSSGTHFFLKILSQIQISEIIKDKIKGSKAAKNSLKKEFAGKDPVISELVIKQSNERKVSDDEPILSIG